MIVIPNVMGIVIYSPRINEHQVSMRGIRFAEILTHKYRVNLFDQLVYQDHDINMEDEEFATATESPEATSTVAFFELCTAAGLGDMIRVSEILRDSKDRGDELHKRADYDGRTALHIACSDGRFDVARQLVEYGANIKAKDRWGNSSLDDCLRNDEQDGKTGQLTVFLRETLQTQEDDKAYGHGYVSLTESALRNRPEALRDNTTCRLFANNLDRNSYAGSTAR